MNLFSLKSKNITTIINYKKQKINFSDERKEKICLKR